MANLEFRASYFKKHNEAWDGFSEDLSDLRARFIDAQPEQSALIATFLPGWIDSYRKVESAIEDDLLGKGVEATREVGDKLEESCRMYLRTEAENAAEADAILAKVGY